MRIVSWLCVTVHLPSLLSPQHPSAPPDWVGPLTSSASFFHFPELKHYPGGWRLVGWLYVDHSQACWDQTINFNLKIKNHQFFHQIPNMGRNFGSVSVRLLKYELHKSQSRLGWSGVMASNCSLDYHQESCFNIFTDKSLLNWTVRWR